VAANPQLSLLKTANVPSVSSAGSVVTYTIAVSNSGNTSLSNVAVSDPLGPVICPSSGTNIVNSLAVGASENCSISYTVLQTVFDSNGGGDGDIDNTATASATFASLPLSANGSATVGLTINPALTILKQANTAGPVNNGDNIGYNFLVTNSGNVTLTNITVTDVHYGLGIAPIPGGETIQVPFTTSSDAGINGTWDTLAPGDTVKFTSSYIVVQADIDNQ
jgi:large repetitive protein